MRTRPATLQLEAARLDVQGLLLGAFRAHEHELPGVAASVREVAAQLAVAGTVRDRATVADWLQQQAEDHSSPVERVAPGHYSLRCHDASLVQPSVALGPTHRLALQVAAQLHACGHEAWSLWDLVNTLAAADGAAPGRRRMHDVVTGLRAMCPPLVEPATFGTYALTAEGRRLAGSD